MKRKLLSGIAVLAGAFLLSFSIPSDQKVPNYSELEKEIHLKHEHDSKGWPCHPAGDIGPCGHFNIYGYPIHRGDLYPCEHWCW